MHNGEASTPAFIFPQPSESVHSLPLERPRELAETPSSSSVNLAESTSTLDARSSHPPPQSNLSILMARYYSRSPSRETAEEEEEDPHTPVVSTPTPRYQPHEGQQYTLLPTTRPTSSPLSLTERTPLLPLPSFQVAHYTPHKWVARARSTGAEAARALPAVILGLLLNILDGISCTSFNAYASRLRSNDQYHLISRWHDHLSGHGCVYGPRYHGGVYVLCLVGYLPCLTNLHPLTV